MRRRWSCRRRRRHSRPRRRPTERANPFLSSRPRSLSGIEAARQDCALEQRRNVETIAYEGPCPADGHVEGCRVTESTDEPGQVDRAGAPVLLVSGHDVSDGSAHRADEEWALE